MRARFALVLLFVSPWSLPAIAQDDIPTKVTDQNRSGEMPFSTSIGTQIEHVDVGSAALNIVVPIVKFPGRNGMDFEFSLHWNSNQYMMAPRTDGLMYDGVFDKFPNLKVVAAHAGGYMPSYLGRSEVACDVRANAGCLNKKKPSEYLKSNVYADSMIFSPEGIRHMVAEMGASHIVYGTDIPLVWPDTIDAVLNAQISDADKEAILGGNLTKLLRLKT